MITVRPINELFKVEIEAEGEKIGLYFKQLDYMTKAHITSLTTNIEKGEIMIDSLGQVYYNLKYALKKVEGFGDEDGNEYKLRFVDKGERELEDDCVDELLATVFSDIIQYTAKMLSDSVAPKEILHPMTGKPLEGVSVIPSHKLKGVQKK